VIKDLKPQEVFWIIKSGIKMTGMPSFGADPSVSDQTIWTMVAFLKKLPSVSDEDFKVWSAAPPGGR
jgi:Cytochrome C oxidase, cbb3-type, subunit III